MNLPWATTNNQSTFHKMLQMCCWRTSGAKSKSRGWLSFDFSSKPIDISRNSSDVLNTNLLKDVRREVLVYIVQELSYDFLSVVLHIEISSGNKERRVVLIWGTYKENHKLRNQLITSKHQSAGFRWCIYNHSKTHSKNNIPKFHKMQFLQKHWHEIELGLGKTMSK